ncbi:hypothetical protein [Hymenobacter glacieicola]|uniref:Uncharacterized protein n=1 Tax=Hymenobacter glacieicola TaxID=1562124 RepID=A0ABQ1WXT6_9BACT|nr:hypothetical protein [Hymenobacter glacieicola]GGG49920.1 hypothetical protein GCM10011378_27510 [Hymenobacter glacieicola]
MKLYQTHKNLIPLLALSGVCIYTVLLILFDKVYYQGSYYDRAFSVPHDIGFAGVVVSLLVYFLKRSLFKPVLILTLTLGLFNFANFTPDKTSVGIGPIGIQPLSLLLIAIYYFLNKRSAHRLLRAYVLPSPSPQRQAENRLESVAKFKSAFARKSDESLLEIVQKRAVVPDALEAAKQLLQERGVTVSSNAH